MQPATQRTNGSCGRFCFAEVEKSGGDAVVKVLECVGEHYECHDQPIAKVYRWCPATISLECECGERPTLSSSRTTCAGCGADHTDVIVEVLETPMEQEKGEHPWRSLRSYFTRPKPLPAR